MPMMSLETKKGLKLLVWCITNGFVIGAVYLSVFGNPKIYDGLAFIPLTIVYLTGAVTILAFAVEVFTKGALSSDIAQAALKEGRYPFAVRAEIDLLVDLALLILFAYANWTVVTVFYAIVTVCSQRYRERVDSRIRQLFEGEANE